MALVAASESLRKRLGEIDVPFLVQHGDADRVVAVEGSIQLQKQATSADKAIRIYEGGSHNLMHELPDTLSTVRADFLSWIGERAVAAGGAAPRPSEIDDATAPLAFASKGAAAAAAAASAASLLLLRRATSSVAPETIAFAAAALAAFRAAASIAPPQSNFGPSTDSSSAGLWDRRDSPPKAAPAAPPSGAALFFPKADEDAHASAALAGLSLLSAEEARGWKLEIRRTSSAISAATLLAYAAAVGEGRGRLGRA
jgi:hypothetical protein